MTIPGVDPLTSLAFVAAIDQTERFRSSRLVGAHFGLTPRKYQSGETDHSGRIPKCGDRNGRTALFEAANVMMMRSTKASDLKIWACNLAKRIGMKKAKVILGDLAPLAFELGFDANDNHTLPAHAVFISIC